MDRKEKRNPPIMVKEAGKIGEFRNALEKAEIEAEFKAVIGDFQVFTTGSEAYRRAVKTLEQGRIGAHWFMFKQDRPLRTVIKGIPVGVDEEVTKELTGMGFKVDSVARMRRDKANPYDMVAGTSERSEEGKELFDVNKVGGFRVRVESKRKPVAQQQCFRCQEFGECTIQVDIYRGLCVLCRRARV